MSGVDAYARAGVDTAAGDAVVDGIQAAVRSTWGPGVIGDFGGFAGLFSLMGRFRDPLLVSGTDGVGTKLLVAQRVGRHDTIGQDLVAMCVNDVLTTGAEPLFFLDYFATGKLAPDVAVEVVKGIAAGCRLAGCALIGGETAEMPGMYAPGHYDLAGFCVGAVERDSLIDGRRVRAGDCLVGVPSSGVHSNGYSLVRHICDGLDWSAAHGLGAPLAEVLLRPTRIYTPEVRALQAGFDLRALAHVTGAGLPGNVPRVLPAGLGARFDRGSWPVPPVFDFLAAQGGLSEAELLHTFNLGLGLVAVVPAAEAAAAAAAVGGFVVGTVVEDEAQGVTLA